MAVTRFEVTSRTGVGGGASFDGVGPYELVKGVLHYAVDPEQPDSQLITDIDLAPAEADGKVHFSGDVQVIKPVNPRPGGSMLLDVVNRGNRIGLTFNNAGQAQGGEIDLGNGFLMRHGWTVVSCGWQTDVPEGRIRLQAPEALDANGNRLIGQTYQQFDLNRSSKELLLSDRDHVPLPAADLDDAEAMLIERDWPDGPPTTIPRQEWHFGRWVDGEIVPDTDYICRPAGFQSGKVYEIVYNTVGATLIGLGFLAMRDCGSFFKYGTAAEGNPCAGSLERAYMYGASQSGRTVREFIYLGLNLDEAGRMVCDGLLPHTSSSRLGEFNLRFDQPSSNHLRNTGNITALTYSESTDPVTEQTDGLLKRQQAKGGVPKIIASNTGVEHWWTAATLTHIDPTGSRDIPPPENVRVYHLASSKHAAGSLPLTGAGTQQHWSNTLDYRPFQRAALLNLDRWVREGVEPPPSKMPRVADGTAVRREDLRPVFESIPGMGFLEALPVRSRLDFGPDLEKGIARYPATELEPRVTMVSTVDEDGNEVAGVRLPDISVPLGTHTGWALRHPDIGGEGHNVPLQGSVVPFPRTAKEREERGDPRRSIEERYASKEDYLARVRRAADDLAQERYILEEDVARIVDGASARWDAFLAVATLTPME
jgi:hypothetical protein